MIINITGRQSQQGHKEAEMSNSLTYGLYGKLLPTSFSTLAAAQKLQRRVQPLKATRNLQNKYVYIYIYIRKVLNNQQPMGQNNLQAYIEQKLNG